MVTNGLKKLESDKEQSKIDERDSRLFTVDATVEEAVKKSGERIKVRRSKIGIQGKLSAPDKINIY